MPPSVKPAVDAPEPEAKATITRGQRPKAKLDSKGRPITEPVPEPAAAKQDGPTPRVVAVGRLG